VLDAVEQIDLGAFYAAYRADGWGRAAFEPKMMLALLLYAYAVGERSSRAIERRCREDIAFRVIAANQTPDHATIARFRARHEGALGELFTKVLRLCAGAGLLALGLIALDGTKLAANASRRANRPYGSICAEVEAILAEAAVADAAEDARWGERRGDELPEALRDRHSRRARLQAAKATLEAELAERTAAHEARLAERARLEATRGARLRAGLQRPGRHHGCPDRRGRRVVHRLARCPPARPDDRAARDELARIGLRESPRVLVADAGYWNVPQIEARAATGLEVLVAPDSPARARDAGPATARQAPGRALPGHAPRPCQPARARPLRAATPGRGADLRTDQGGVSLRPLPAARARRLPLGVAPDHGDAQPAEALAPPDRLS